MRGAAHGTFFFLSAEAFGLGSDHVNLTDMGSNFSTNREKNSFICLGRYLGTQRRGTNNESKHEQMC